MPVERTAAARSRARYISSECALCHLVWDIPIVLSTFLPECTPFQKIQGIELRIYPCHCLVAKKGVISAFQVTDSVNLPGEAMEVLHN